MTTRIRNTLLTVRRLVSRQFGFSTNKDDTTEDLHISSLLATTFYLIVIFGIGVPAWFWTCSVPRYPLPNVDSILSKSEDLKLKLDVSVVLLEDRFLEKQADALRNLLPSQEVSVNNLTYNFIWRVRRPLAEEVQVISDKVEYKGKKFADNNAQFLQLVESKLLSIHSENNRFRLWIYVMEEQQYGDFCPRTHSFTLGFERFIFVCLSTILEEKDRPQALSRLIMDSVRETFLNSIDIKRVNHLLSSQLDLVVDMIQENDDEIRSLDGLNKRADKIHSVIMKNVREPYPDLTELVNIKVKSQMVFYPFNKKIFEQAIVKQQHSDGYQAPSRQTINVSSVDHVGNSSEVKIRLFDIAKSRQLISSVRSRISEHQEKHIYHLLLLSPSVQHPPLVFHQRSRTYSPQKVEQSLLVGSDSNSMLIWNGDKDLVLGLRALYRHILGLSWTDLHSQCARRNIFFTRWEIDSLMSILTAAKMKKTSKSLESIKDLVNKVSNIVIEKDVTNKMEEALQLSLQSLSSMEQNYIVNAYRLSSKAYDLSESAFFDPSLLELLYFPHDQKYAIYIPLFMPLSFPIGYSVFRLIKSYFVYRRQSKSTIKKKSD